MSFSLFGLFGASGAPVTQKTLVKRLSAAKADWDDLPVDEHDHLENVWTPGDIRLTLGGVSVQTVLRPCNSNAREMRLDVKKRVTEAFYITPHPFEVQCSLADGRRVNATLRFRLYNNAKLTSWILAHVDQPGKNYEAGDVAQLLDARRMGGRGDFEELFDIDAYAESAAPRMRLEVGATVLDRYVIERELGSGGMGKVFLARNQDTAIESRRKVVIKIMHDSLCRDERSRQQFIREANTLSEMHDDRIAACFECRFLGETPVLVMEYI